MFYKGLALLFSANSGSLNAIEINVLQNTLNVIWEVGGMVSRHSPEEKRRDATGVERPSGAGP